MNIKLPKQVTTIFAKLKPIAKHHYFLYIFALLLGLVWGTFMVNQALTTPRDENYKALKVSEALDGTFDQDTINRIENLQKSSEQSQQQTAPASGRTNPFAE